MKKILCLLILISAGFIGNAQTVKFKKGQVLTITTSMTQEMDMGIAGQMSSSSKNTSVIEIKAAEKDGYKASSKLAKLNISIDAMGQNQTFDSEKPEDMNGEIGKQLGDRIGKESNMFIDNTTGVATPENKDIIDVEKKNEEEAFSGMLDLFGQADKEGAVAESVIFILPRDKKAGDSWQDSSEVKNKSKVYKTYTVKSIQDGIATIAISTKMNGSMSTETQGMQMNITLDTKSEGEMIVDTNTSLIKKINNVSNINGSMDVMEQSVPIISKLTELIEIN